MTPRVIAASLALTLVAGIAVPASATVECHGVTLQARMGAVECPMCRRAAAKSAKDPRAQISAPCCAVRAALPQSVIGSPEQIVPAPLAAATIGHGAVAVLALARTLSPCGSAVDPSPPPLQRVLPLLD